MEKTLGVYGDWAAARSNEIVSPKIIGIEQIGQTEEFSAASIVAPDLFSAGARILLNEFFPTIALPSDHLSNSPPWPEVAFREPLVD